jgi:hypothetical protein
MTPNDEKVLKQAGEVLTDLGLDIVGLASHTYDDEVVAELMVNINHLNRVAANLTALCHAMQQPQVLDSKPFE